MPNAFVIRRENGEEKCESAYKPLTDTGSDEEHRNLLHEKDKLGRIQEGLGDEVAEKEDENVNEIKNECRLAESDQDEDELVV